MIDDAGNGVKAQGALSDFFVPVLMAPQGVLVVVQMDGVKPGKADDFVKVAEHAIQIVHYVVAAVIYMAGVQAYSQPVLPFRSVYNGRQFLEGAAHFGAFPGHGFQQYILWQFFLVHGVVQHVGNQNRGFFNALLQMGAGVEIVHAAGQMGRFGQVFPHGSPRKVTHALLRGGAVHGVGAVTENGAEMVHFHPPGQPFHVFFYEGLGLSAPGISGKELECIAAKGGGSLCHGQKAFGNR